MIVTDPPTLNQDKRGTHATQEIRWLCSLYKKVTGKKQSLQHCADQMLKDFFIVSATMCVPLNDEGYERAPLYKEIKACATRLQETIYAVDPLIILCFGPHARAAVFAKRTGLDTTSDRLEYVDIPGKLGLDVRYSVLLASSLRSAEDAGDYHYSNGKVASVQKALSKGLALVQELRNEDKP